MIGRTPLILLKNTNFDLDSNLVYLKDESRNIYGTIKDRRNSYIIEKASQLRVDKLVLITSGNSGYSLSNLANGTGIKVTCVVDKHINKSIKKELDKTAFQVIEMNLQSKILRPEELITVARERDNEVIWDVSNGYEEAYGGMIEEIIQEVIPDYIVVPVGSGGIFTGMVQEIARRRLKTKVLGVGVEEKLSSFADKLNTPWTPYERALNYYCEQGNKIYKLSEDEIVATYKKSKHIITCEPSSSIVFSIFKKHVFKSTDIIVLVNSGKSRIK